MVQPDDNVSAYLHNRALLLLLITVSLALGWILLPFHGAILWGCVIGLLFAPVHRWLLHHVKRKPTLAALLTLLTALVIVIVPFVIVSAALTHEAMLIYHRVQSGEWNPALYFHRLFDALPPRSPRCSIASGCPTSTSCSAG